jgi:hypothetical protein
MGVLAAVLALALAPAATAKKGEPSGGLRGTVKVRSGKTAKPLVAGVYLTGGPNDAPYLARSRSMRQHNLKFSPGILIISVGDSVWFPNDDGATDHSVFSPNEKYGFDLHKYGGGTSKQHSFGHAGEYDIRCSIHPQMKATILAVNSAYVAETDANGDFLLEGVPPGDYTLHAWAPDRVEVEVAVTVVDGKVMQSPALEFPAGKLKKSRDHKRRGDKTQYPDRY